MLFSTIRVVSAVGQPGSSQGRVTDENTSTCRGGQKLSRGVTGLSDGLGDLQGLFEHLKSFHTFDLCVPVNE